MMEWLHFVAAHRAELWLRTDQHILLTGTSTLIAICLGIPLGILAARRHWLRGLITGGVGILQTIPSLAMLAILLALLNRIGTLPAIIALVLYALLPIVRNTLAGLSHVPAPIKEAADGMGMTRRQRLWLVELPLAAPVIVTGIRTAAVVGVGIATLSAFIGAARPAGGRLHRGRAMGFAAARHHSPAALGGPDFARRRRLRADDDFNRGPVDGAASELGWFQNADRR